LYFYNKVTVSKNNKWLQNFDERLHHPALVPPVAELILGSGLVVQVVSASLHGNWQDFNGHSTSHGPSAIAELLVVKIITVTFSEVDKSLIQFYRKTTHLGARRIIKLFPEKEMDIKLNAIGYKIWGIMQDRVYACKITSVGGTQAAHF